MTWMRVDDQLHSHPKAAEVSAGAMGLWVMAGSWSAAQLTDGFVPERMATRLYPEARELAGELVEAGLWEACEAGGRRGWRFHDWADHQPMRAEVIARREDDRARKAAARATRAASTGPPPLAVAEASAARPGGHLGEAARSPGGVAAASALPDPTRPDPTQGGGAREYADPPPAPPSAIAGQGGAPPRRCQAHLGWEHPPPCPGCADARRAREDYDAAAARAPTPSASSPPCPTHPDQSASRCPACAAEAVPPPTSLREAIRRSA